MNDKTLLLDTILAALNYGGCADDIFFNNKDFMALLSDIKDGRVKLVRNAEELRPHEDTALVVSAVQYARSYPGYALDLQLGHWSEKEKAAIERLTKGETIIVELPKAND